MARAGLAFVMAVGGPAVSEGWYHLFQISFFFGYAVSGGLFYILNLVSPPRGLGEQVNFELTDSGVVIRAVDAAGGHDQGSGEVVGEKRAAVTADEKV